jgi:hypothetical protein
MLQFNNNHIFTGYLKQFLSSFNLPTCKIYTAEFEKFYAEHGYEDPRVIESYLPIKVSTTKVRPGAGITYLKEGCPQQYFWDTSSWKANINYNHKNQAKVSKYWKSNKSIHYDGNKILGLTKTLKNPTTLYNYQTHEYLGDYLRFLRDYENINLMSMYNCFSDRLCNNLKFKLEWKVNKDTGANTQTLVIDSYDTNYKIYMLPVKLFEKYTIAIDCYQGAEIFCGFYTKKLDMSAKAEDLIKQTYVKVPKALFNQPFIYDKLDITNWNWCDEMSQKTVKISSSSNTTAGGAASGMTSGGMAIQPPKVYSTDKILRSEVATRENELKLFIKVPVSNKSSITILEGDYRNFNDSLYTITTNGTWQYFKNTTVANFETTRTNKESKLPDLNLREFKPISKLQLLALNTGISYPFADRLVEYLVANVILPNDTTADNIKRLQKVMEDCGYSFQIDGIWESKMQMILYDYLMNGGKFTVATEKDTLGNILYQDTEKKKPVYKTKKDIKGNVVYDKAGNPIYLIENKRTGNLRQRGQKSQADFYDILGYVDKDAEKLYASWKVEVNEKTKKPQVTAKTTLENVDIYSNLYNV